MLKRLWLTVPIALLLLTACSVVQGSGKVVTEQRRVTDFNQVDLNSVGEMIVTQGETYSLTIEAEENILPLLETKVENHRLVIGLSDNVAVNLSQPIRFWVTMAEVDGLAVSSSGEISAETLESEQLALDVSGSGTIAIGQLVVDSLDVTIDGSGEIELSGQAAHQTVAVSGSGQYRAAGLTSSSADVDSSGSGEVVVWVNDTLAAHLSGSANVAYYGDPVVRSELLGSGVVTGLDGR